MQTSTPYDEKQLLLRIAEGDQAAFRNLFDLYKVRLFTFVVNLINSRADAEEIVQEIFIKLWEKRDSLAQVEHPGSYIYTIARNKTINHLEKIALDKKLVKQVWANMSQPENPTEDILHAHESQALIHQAVAQLSPQKQLIFNLSRHDGLTHEEIANRLGLSKSTIKNSIVEILKFIKAFLGRHSELLAIVFWLSYARLLF